MRFLGNVAISLITEITEKLLRYVTKKRIVPKLWIEDMNKDFVNISRPYLSYFPRNKSSKSFTVGPGQFTVLNDSASAKMIIKMDFNFFQFYFKILDLYSCR